jgi:hypothetical protein
MWATFKFGMEMILRMDFDAIFQDPLIVQICHPADHIHAINHLSF